MGMKLVNGYVVEVKMSEESTKKIIDGFIACRNDLDISDPVKKNECIKSLNEVIESFSKRAGKWTFYSAKVDYDKIENFYYKAIEESSSGDAVRILSCVLKVSSESNYCISWDNTKPFELIMESKIS